MRVSFVLMLVLVLLMLPAASARPEPVKVVTTIDGTCVITEPGSDMGYAVCTHNHGDCAVSQTTMTVAGPRTTCIVPRL